MDHGKTDIGWEVGAPLLFILAFIVGIGILVGVALTPPSLGEAKDTITDIETAQQKHFDEAGAYFSVIEYRTPSGERGYEVKYEDADTVYTKGYGPEAEARTSSREKHRSATSTHETPR